jgi:eukaryotic-like serine/threonine-protein kinase
MTPVSKVCQKCGTEIPADAPEGGCPGCLLETALDAAGGEMVFGRYRLIKVLGRGGMGIVWLARDQELERDVALKFLPDLMVQDRALLDQLKRETKRCLELTHPHIVRIHDFVHDERSGCISMEHVNGETLSNSRAEKEHQVFQPEEIAGWIAQLCDALDYAHNHAEVIHRDLKPSNLMVNRRGDLKITDFGIARSLADSATRLTSQQGRSGTLVYMSPQQLSGERSTHLDDIYSLGATIYELLTSKPPFYSGNIDRQICERAAPLMTERRKEFNIEPALVSKVWEDAVALCLAKDPARRPQSAVEVAQRLQLPPGSARVAIAPARPAKKKLLFVSGIAAALGLVLAAVYFGESKPHSIPISQLPGIPEKSIAVLPFENRSEEQANAYFAEGIQDEILTRLSKIADLKVISRTSTQHYKSAPENLPHVARELGVAHILEGSVQKSGDSVRVNVQLISAANDSHLWAETFDRSLTDIFSVESEVAEKIAASLQARLSGREQQALKSKPTDNPEAYDLYLRGRYLLNKRTVESLQGARELFQQAVVKDPSFALGHAGIADAYILLGKIGVITGQEAATNAWPEVSSALAIDNQLSEGYVSRAILLNDFEWNWPAAEQDYRKALELNPNGAAAHQWYARHLAQIGRSQEALREIITAQKHDPLSPVIRVTKAKILFVARSYNQSIDPCVEALELEPDFSSAFSQLGQAYAHRGDYPKAIEAAKKYVELSGGTGWAKLELAYAYAVAGDRTESERIVKDVTTQPGHFSPYDMATIRSAARDTAGALSWLEKAIEERSVDVIWIRVDPRLDGVRADAGFQKVLTRMNPHR